MNKTDNNTDFLGMVDNLILTSDKIKDINSLLGMQTHETEIKNTGDNFSKLYTLIDYNTEQINILKDNLNKIWDALNKQINKK